MLIVVRANMALLWDRLFDKLEYQNLKRQLRVGGRERLEWDKLDNCGLCGAKQGVASNFPGPTLGETGAGVDMAKYDIGAVVQKLGPPGRARDSIDAVFVRGGAGSFADVNCLVESEMLHTILASGLRPGDMQYVRPDRNMHSGQIPGPSSISRKLVSDRLVRGLSVHFYNLLGIRKMKYGIHEALTGIATIVEYINCECRIS